MCAFFSRSSPAQVFNICDAAEVDPPPSQLDTGPQPPHSSSQRPRREALFRGCLVVLVLGCVVVTLARGGLRHLSEDWSASGTDARGIEAALPVRSSAAAPNAVPAAAFASPPPARVNRLRNREQLDAKLGGSFTHPGSALATALARSESLAACLERNMQTRQPSGMGADPDLADRPVFAVTSVTGPFARAIASRKPTPFMNTLWMSNPAHIPPLIVYHEDRWDAAHGREKLDPATLPVAECYVDVFDAAPNLEAALRDESSNFNEIYTLPGIRSLSDNIMDGKALVRKVVAIAHAAAHLPDRALLVWFDVDTQIFRPFDANWVRNMVSRDLTYIAETDCIDAARSVRLIWELPPGPCLDFRIDTGIFAIVLGARTRRFFANAQRWYDGDMLAVARMCLASQSWSPQRAQRALLPRRSGEEAYPFADALGAAEMVVSWCELPWVRNNLGLNDIHVLAMAMHQDPDLTQQWFAIGSNGGKFAHPGMCSPHAARESEMLVMDYEMQRYARHIKGGVGIMATRDAGEPEDGESRGRRSKPPPPDPEVALGLRQKNLMRDGRCACNDASGTVVRPELLTTASHEQCDVASMARVDLRRQAFRAATGEDLNPHDRGYPNFPFCPERSQMPTGLNGECAFELSRDTEYLPDALLLERARTGPSDAWFRSETEMRAAYDALQNPADCSNPVSTDWRQMAWTWKDKRTGVIAEAQPKGKKGGPGNWHLLKWGIHGHGNNLWMLARTIGSHFLAGVPVVLSNTMYRFSDLKCGHSWTCFMSPLTPRCTLANIKDHSRVLVYHRRGETNAVPVTKLCAPNGRYDLEHGRCVCNAGFTPTLDIRYAYCRPIATIAADYQGRPNEAGHHQRVATEHSKHTAEEKLHNLQPLWNDIAPGEDNPQANSESSIIGGRWVAGLPPGKMTTLRKATGYLWFHAQLMWALHDKAPRRRELENYVAGLKMGGTSGRGTCIAVHVRHGDSCGEKDREGVVYKTCKPLADYLDAARKIALKYPFLFGSATTTTNSVRIYLATDDPVVVADAARVNIASSGAAKSARGGGVRFHITVQTVNRAKYNDPHVPIDTNHALDNDDGTIGEIYRDLWAMSTCGAFVGSFTSSFAWITYELMLARQRHFPPFIAVDGFRVGDPRTMVVHEKIGW